MPEMPKHVVELVEQLATISGVVAVVLGGSRAVGAARPDSDWDLGVYYRASRKDFAPSSVRALGYQGEVSELGEWGPLVNGGGWLKIAGIEVDVLFRDLGAVEGFVTEAEQGRFDILLQPGSVVGSPTYLPVGELASCKVLQGELAQPEHYPPALATTAANIWRGKVGVNLMFARGYATLGDTVACLGMLSQAVLSQAHAILAEQKQWALNEKRLITEAGLQAVQDVLVPSDTTATELMTTVDAVEDFLGIRSASKG